MLKATDLTAINQKPVTIDSVAHAPLIPMLGRWRQEDPCGPPNQTAKLGLSERPPSQKVKWRAMEEESLH